MIITAAGRSTRQKHNKLLLFSGKEIIIERTIKIFLNLKLDIFVVVGHRKEEIIPLLEQRFQNEIQLVLNEDYKTGIASSIKAGLREAKGNYDYYGFCNGDKPFIKTETVKSMLHYLDQNAPNILVPLYQDVSGHPTFFSKSLIKEFYNISGDVGGMEIIKKYPNLVTYLPVNDNGITLDMDEYLKE